MAKIFSPVPSFDPRGAIGRAIVYSSWKGINYVRAYVTGTDPRTPRQLAQRSRLTIAVLQYHAIVTTPALREAWRQLVCQLDLFMNGWNAALQALMTQYQIDPSSSFPHSFTLNPNDSITVNTINLDTGDPGTESGPFAFSYGPNLDALTYTASLILDPQGRLITPVLTNVGPYVYWHIYKGTHRTGIVATELN